MIEPLVLPADAGRSAPDGPPPVVVQRAPVPPVRLDLACGQSPREGFEGVDLYAPGRRAVNLLRFPWPWGDRSVDELHCSHFVEHIPTVYVAPDGSTGEIPRSAREWREMNRLGHYRVDCEFTGPGRQGVPLVEGQVPMEESLRAPEVQAERVGTLWNIVGNWRAVLVVCRGHCGENT